MIAIDIDSTVADMITVMLKMQNEKHGTNYKIDQIKEWNQRFPEFGLKEAVRELFADDAWMSQIQPMKDSQHALKVMEEKDLEFMFVTNRNAKYAKQTRDWIHKNFGYYEVLHVEGSKKRDDLDVLIDDAPHNLMDFKKLGGRAIVFDQPWNRQLLDIPRLRNWQRMIIIADQLA